MPWPGPVACLGLACSCLGLVRAQDGILLETLRMGWELCVTACALS